MERRYYVYILTNWNHSVLYVGVTNNITRRLYEHQQELVEGFTQKYHVHKLVFVESCGDAKSAIAREKQIKRWTREKKNRLIESQNPNWKEITP